MLFESRHAGVVLAVVVSIVGNVTSVVAFVVVKPPGPTSSSIVHLGFDGGVDVDVVVDDACVDVVVSKQNVDVCDGDNEDD